MLVVTQKNYGGNVLEYGSCYGFVCCEYRFLSFPHVVDVSALSICIVLRDLYMFVVCEFWVECQSLYFWVDVHGCVMLYISNASCVLYSVGSGVKRVNVVLSGLRIRLFVCVHVLSPAGMIECLR